MVNLEGKALLYTVTLLTALGFLLIGFDNGVMGGLVGGAAFNETFGTPGPTMIGLIVAIYEVGCFLGAVLTSFVGEGLGRRKSIMIGAAIMLVGAILQATSYSRAQMIVARVVSGVGMGFLNSTMPVLQSEYSPKATRGLYVCIQLSTLNFGIFLSYWVDYGFSTIPNPSSYCWRIPVILQCVFIIPIMFMPTLIPETPRWLIAHGRADEALGVLTKLHRDDHSHDDIDRIHQGMVDAVAVETSLGSGSWKDLLHNDSIQSQKRFLIACSIQIFQQAGGINGLIYYAGIIFSQSLGFGAYMSSLMSGFLFTWFFIASFIPWALIDRVGRRPLLLSMISLMAIVFAIQAALIRQIQLKTSIAHTAGIGAAVMLFIYLGAFTVGFQATVWVYPAEILPLRLRQRGSAVSTACNWIINYVIVQITPPGIANIGWKFYIIFAILNACFVPVIYVFYPETKGMELEDIDKMFAKGDTFEQEAHHDRFRNEKGSGTVQVERAV